MVVAVTSTKEDLVEEIKIPTTVEKAKETVEDQLDMEAIQVDVTDMVAPLTEKLIKIYILNTE